MQSLLFAETVPSLPGYPCVLSSCGQYRYTCYRLWKPVEKPRLCLWVCLNPSTATASEDDPSVRRMIGYAKAWQFDGICVCNLFAFRATDPNEMKSQTDPCGDDNDYWIVQAAEHCELIVCGWGLHGAHQSRDMAVLALFKSLGRELHCLKLTAEGFPNHPLYAKSDISPVLFRRAEPHESEKTA